MKQTYWLVLVALSCFGVTPASAQQVVPPLKKEFLDSTFQVIPSAAGAYYRRETEYTDSVGGVMRDYFLNGKLQSIGTFDHIRKNIAHGTFENWYPNGQLKWHQESVHGKKEGETRLYYSSGQLKRHEIYAADKMTSGECYRADGQPVPFFPYEVMPVYSQGDGGFRAIVMAIGSNVKYPMDALKANITGRVFVSFEVTSLGRIANIQVVKSVFPSIDAAAVQAVRQLRKFTPGQQDGHPVAVSFTVPINFALEDRRSIFDKRTRYEVPPTN